MLFFTMLLNYLTLRSSRQCWLFQFRVDDYESGELLGYFYLDLLYRYGKYVHGAKVIKLQNGCIDLDGKRQVLTTYHVIPILKKLIV